jgi:hypothetical protein
MVMMGFVVLGLCAGLGVLLAAIESPRIREGVTVERASVLLVVAGAALLTAGMVQTISGSVAG